MTTPNPLFNAVFQQLRGTTNIVHSRNEGATNFNDIAAQDLDLPIISIVVTCTKGRQSVVPGGRVATSYHWRLFLATSQNSSVELQVQLLSKGDGSCMTLGMSRAYKVTRNVVGTIEETARSQWTLRRVLNHLFDVKRRHCFIFDVATGSGCRSWCHLVIGDLEEVGMLHPGARGRVERYTAGVAGWCPDDMPTPAPTGRFF